MFILNYKLFDSKSADVIYDGLNECFQISIYTYYVLDNYRRTTKGRYDIVKNYYTITIDYSETTFKAIEKMKKDGLGYIEIEKKIKEDEILLRSIVYIALNNKSKAITFNMPFDKSILQSGYVENTCQKGLEYVIRTYAKQDLDKSISYTDLILEAY